MASAAKITGLGASSRPPSTSTARFVNTLSTNVGLQTILWGVGGTISQPLLHGAS